MASTDEEKIAKAKEECLLGAHFLWQELRDAYGHVSCRLPGGGFALKFARIGPGIDPDDVQIFDDAGQLISGQASTPLEITIHT